MGRGRYRWRTAIRRRLPSFLIDLGVARRGKRDCGAHDFHNVDDVIERCYHCEVGERPYDPAHFLESDGALREWVDSLVEAERASAKRKSIGS